jgi:hypothetical protein
MFLLVGCFIFCSVCGCCVSVGADALLLAAGQKIPSHLQIRNAEQQIPSSQQLTHLMMTVQ